MIKLISGLKNVFKTNNTQFLTALDQVVLQDIKNSLRKLIWIEKKSIEFDLGVIQ